MDSSACKYAAERDRRRVVAFKDATNLEPLHPCGGRVRSAAIFRKIAPLCIALIALGPRLLARRLVFTNARGMRARKCGIYFPPENVAVHYLTAWNPSLLFHEIWNKDGASIRASIKDHSTWEISSTPRPSYNFVVKLKLAYPDALETYLPVPISSSGCCRSIFPGVIAPVRVSTLFAFVINCFRVVIYR